MSYSAEVRLIVPWIGLTPAWIGQFLQRIRASAPFVSVQVVPIYWQNPWKSFRHRIFTAVGVMPPLVIEPRKLCDYRPAFGEIFRREIGHAEWWGWCDLDCVFGDFNAFLAPEVLEASDLVTDHASIVNGPLTIVRNEPGMNMLYRERGHFRDIFAGDEHVAFDEKGFTDIVRSVGVRASYLDAHVHDGEGPVPRVEGRKLFAGDREVLTYHFHDRKEWPL
jgi:hypothetical protein